MTEEQTGECKKRIFLISVLLVVVGVIGYFTLRGHWAFYPLAHIGALGILSLLGASAGLIALRKGYNFTKAFLIGFLTPIVIGLVAVFALKFSGGKFYCGGSVCLAAAVLTIIGYSLVRKRPAT